MLEISEMDTLQDLLPKGGAWAAVYHHVYVVESETVRAPRGAIAVVLSDIEGEGRVAVSGSVFRLRAGGFVVLSIDETTTNFVSIENTGEGAVDFDFEADIYYVVPEPFDNSKWDPYDLD